MGGIWLTGQQTNQAQLVLDFEGATTISPTSPSITLSVQNIGASPVPIGGVNFFITVGDGTMGPTIDTTAPIPPKSALGVNLLTGTIFDGSPFGQFPIGSPGPRSQAWAVLTLTPVSLPVGATEKLATITFNSFPEGSFALDFRGTSFADSIGGTIANVSLPSGDVTGLVPVPEPEQSGLAFGLGLLAAALALRNNVSGPAKVS